MFDELLAAQLSGVSFSQMNNLYSDNVFGKEAGSLPAIKR